MERMNGSFARDPVSFLEQFPLLTKSDIRANGAALASADLHRRRWCHNTSGGSTGEPIELIQDVDYSAATVAEMILNFERVGRRVGQPALWIWGSERDILEGSAGLKRRVLNALANDIWVNAFRMGPERMRAVLDALNERPPELIISYAQSAYELARFAERHDVRIAPQSAILTSAGTLYGFMRESIGRVFSCEVFDRYGSREVGNIAWECDAHRGLHAFPWSNFIEVVDENGDRVPPGEEGNIVVTCLTNYAMPLIRYKIEDRGVLSSVTECRCGRKSQMLERVTGRTVDTFRTADGTLVDGEYFTHLLYHRAWIEKFQIVQQDYARVVFRIIPRNGDAPREHLEEIRRGVRAALGADCRVDFEFMSELPRPASGKDRYLVSEVQSDERP
jgi:phenylacetate-CoA ligase